MYDSETFGRRLKAARILCGMNQKDLFEKSGVALTSISGYERGKVVPTLRVTARLAEALNVSIDYLSGRSDSIN